MWRKSEVPICHFHLPQGCRARNPDKSLQFVAEDVDLADARPTFCPTSLSTSKVNAFFSAVVSVSLGFSGLIATSDAPGP